MTATDILSLTERELCGCLVSNGAAAFRAEQLFLCLHKKRAQNFDDMRELPQSLRQRLKQTFYIPRCGMERAQNETRDGSVKLLHAVDGGFIETVVIKSSRGSAVCVSSQLGCRFACAFCASGAKGFSRNLTAGEMLLQIYNAERALGIDARRVLLMGTGEPLDNTRNVLRFIAVLREKHGKNISCRHITLSTCGLPGQIRRLADLGLKINLSVSLHAPYDALRKRLMPKASAYSTEEIIRACDYFFKKTGRRVTWEYLLLSGINDAQNDAQRLAALLSGKNAHINLIPYNDTQKNAFKAGDGIFFQNALRGFGLNATVRNSKGGGVAAACGQLRAAF